MIINFSNLGGGGGGSYVLPTATNSRLGGVMIGSGITVDSAGTISAQEYTLPTASSETLGGIKVGSGLTITDGVLSANGGGGDSTALEEISTLPENPEDGAIYNYNGVLIKYVNGAGNWGEWTGLNSVKCYSRSACGSATLFYAVLPSEMDGQLIFGLTSIKSSTADTNIAIWGFLDLQNNVINVYDNKDKTGSTVNTITKNAGSETNITINSNYHCYVSWNDNCIQVRPDNTGVVQMLRYCSTSSNTGHYEIVERPDYNYAVTRDELVGNGFSDIDVRYWVPIFESDGTSRPGVLAYKKLQKINGTYYHPFVSERETLPAIYAPIASGTTGTLCVSQGEAAPQWKTISQALGVDFWTGTQNEYDQIVTKSPTTLYIILPDNS